MIGFAVDAEIVEAVAAGKRVSVGQNPAMVLPRPKEGEAALTKQIAVMQLVDRMLEIEPPQQRIRGHFGGAQDIASAVGFYFGEREQLAQAPVGVAPHPSMNRPHDPVERRSSFHCSHHDSRD